MDFRLNPFSRAIVCFLVLPFLDYLVKILERRVDKTETELDNVALVFLVGITEFIRFVCGKSD